MHNYRIIIQGLAQPLSFTSPHASMSIRDAFSAVGKDTTGYTLTLDGRDVNADATIHSGQRVVASQKLAGGIR